MTILNYLYENPDSSVLNCVSDRLALSSLLSYIFPGALIYSFIRAIFCLLCLLCKGQSLTYLPGWGNPCHCIVVLYIYGEGVQEGTMPLARLSVGFQSFPLLHTSKLGPAGADSQVGGFVYVLGRCGSLQQTLL